MTTPVSVVEKLPPSKVPSCRLAHVKLSEEAGGDEVIVPLWEAAQATVTEMPGALHVPHKLLYAADWIYDIELRRIIKNSTGRNFLVPLGVPQVDRSWLGDKGFMRVRRRLHAWVTGVNQFTPTDLNMTVTRL